MDKEEIERAVREWMKTSAQFEIVAILPDGQEMNDEVHVGYYSGMALTADRAAAAIAHLESDRPEGHEDVRYEIRTMDFA